jgi:ubiquinone/menaquinone biosynthesis C-methylase UbiE
VIEAERRMKEPVEVRVPRAARFDAPMDPAFVRYSDQRTEHWDSIARRGDGSTKASRAYHKRLRDIYRFLIPPGLRILELGCGKGELLAALEPSVGLGIDLSSAMVHEAQRRHPSLRFVQGDAHALSSEGPFDAVILSDLVNELWDVQRVLESVRGVCTARTRIIINAYSRLWEWPLSMARRFGLAKPMLRQNWLTVEDIRNLLDLAGFETIRTTSEVVCPLRIPLVAPLLNRFVAKVWPFKHLALTNFIIARPKPDRPDVGDVGGPSVTVVVPARNEAGNVPAILERIPKMGSRTEVVFVEGNSTDDTFAVLERELSKFNRLPWALLKQDGKGKGNAVRKGFEAARGDIVMILDADLTVPPEDLPRFYEALRSGTGEFVNGVRLVYPMEERAMRFLNLVGNKFFSLAFSWLLGQRIKDTLCGTKALWREDYLRIAANRSYFGDFDPFGDFDLIFGAAKLNLKVVDMPVRYRERVYGETNIHRWKHGWLLLRMVAFGARRLKFV